MDIRSQGSELHIHHDPYIRGESFEDWLQHYQHGTLILNVKEEGLEERLIALMRARGITDYFFLDQSFPFLVKWAEASGGRCAVRVSEFESLDTALSLANKVNWVWVDCFTRFPLDTDSATRLKKAGFRLCLVSPELQGRTDDTDVLAFIQQLRTLGIAADAVCSKRPDLWENAGG